MARPPEGAAADPGAFAALESARFLSLTTYRRSGAPVATPMGPIVRDGKLYFFTPVQSGKVRRLRNNPQVEVAPCTRSGKVTGPAVAGLALLLEARRRRAWTPPSGARGGCRSGWSVGWSGCAACAAA
jgi:PPOX class probable F420-dependent enzyme